ncbi:MAG TPA: PilN domain-containing protein [Patescibacteria group bacterium]|jgi:Tfp pilus assembly protein PilN
MKNELVTIDIDLVPQDPFFQTRLGRTLQWALSAGRYIVMFTELIVVLSFATRFYLDRRVTDLNQTIARNSALVQSYGSFEEEFRSTQEKINQYQQIVQHENLAEVFPLLSQVIPAGVELQELAITAGQVSIVGQVLAQRSLNLLINNLQISPNFSNVVVNTIESQGEFVGGYAFRLSAQTNLEGGR